MNANGKAIATKDLTKRYGEDILAVDEIDLSIPTNSIYALLGPNGAGKTTTVSMLSTLIEPTSGRAQVTGLDVLRHVTSKKLEIPCIILTGRGSEEIAVKMLKEGAFDYLTKPFNAEDLINTIKKAIDIGVMYGDSHTLSQEFMWLKKENSFLRTQLEVIRNVLQMDKFQHPNSNKLSKHFERRIMN